MRSHIVAGLILVAASFVAGCEKAPEESAGDIRQEPVVVYAAFEDDAQLRDLLARYTEETGVLVIVRGGAAEAIVDDLIANKISPPADVLMTRSVSGVWHAAEEGALRALYSESIRQRSPAWARDPDDLWFGTAYTTAVIVHDIPDLVSDDVSDFKSLAEPRFRGSLCLSASANAINRTVIAMMIEAMGVRPAELAVRGWMGNLAAPVFDTEAEVIDAIRSGSCGIGLVSSSAVARAKKVDAELPVTVVTPATTYADVSGVGVARHARNPDGAAALVEWLFSTDVQTAIALQDLTYPANASAGHDEALDVAGPDNVATKNVGLAAWQEFAAAQLAERARYRWH